MGVREGSQEQHSFAVEEQKPPEEDGQEEFRGLKP